MFVRRAVFATVVVLVARAGAVVHAETAEQRFADLREVSLQRSELRVKGRDVPIKLVLLACDAECLSASVIEVSELGDICRILRPADPMAIGGERRFTSAFALRQPRRDQIMQLANDLLRTKPPNVPLPLPRRLLLAYRGDDGWTEQIFDRAHLSVAAQKVVRELADERYLEFGPWVPQLSFDATLQPDQRPEATAFAATDDARLLASVRDRQVILLDRDLQQLRSVSLPEPLTHAAPIELIGRAAFSPDAKWFAVAVNDERIIVLDTENWTVAATISHQSQAGLREIFFTRDSGALVVRNDTAVCFHAGRWARLDDRPAANVVSFRESPGGDRTLLLLADGSLRLRHQPRSPAAREQTETAPEILLAERCHGCISAFSPDGSRLAAITVSSPAAAQQPQSLQTELKVWRVKDGSVVANLLAFGMPIRSGRALQWLPDGVHLAAVSQRDETQKFTKSKTIHLWNVLDGRHVAELVGAHRPVGLAAGGRELFAADYAGQLFRWDLDRLLKRPPD